MTREELKEKYPDIREEVAVAYYKGMAKAYFNAGLSWEVATTHITKAIISGDILAEAGFYYRALQIEECKV